MAYILTTKNMGDKSLPIIKEKFGIDFKVNGEDTLIPTDILIRWGCRGSVPTSGQTSSVINSARKIAEAYNKGATRKKLADVGLAMETYTDAIEWLRKATDGRFVIRPLHHSRSQDLAVASTSQAREAIQFIDSINGWNDGYYISKLINKTKEYRVFIANNRVLWVIRKHPSSEGSISWGCVEQGEFEYVGWSEWPLDVCRVALQSMKVTGLDFGAWDIIVGQENDIYALEVNTAPYLSPYYATTTGKAFQWMIDQKKQGSDINLPDVPEDASWKKFMHPALGSN